MNSTYEPAISEDLVHIAKDFRLWVHKRTNGLELPATNDRVRVSQALIHLSLEHYDSIVVLLMHRLVGSAFALERSLVETCIRAKWILYAASDADVRKFIEKGELIIILVSFWNKSEMSQKQEVAC